MSKSRLQIDNVMAFFTYIYDSFMYYRSWTRKQLEEKQTTEREENEANNLFYLKSCEDDRKALEVCICKFYQ